MEGRAWSWMLSLGLHALLMFGMAAIVILEDEPDSTDSPVQVYLRDQQGLSLSVESEIAYRGRSQFMWDGRDLLIGDVDDRPLMGPAEATCDITDRCAPKPATPW